MYFIYDCWKRSLDVRMVVLKKKCSSVVTWRIQVPFVTTITMKWNTNLLLWFCSSVREKVQAIVYHNHNYEKNLQQLGDQLTTGSIYTQFRINHLFDHRVTWTSPRQACITNVSSWVWNGLVLELRCTMVRERKWKRTSMLSS